MSTPRRTWTSLLLLGLLAAGGCGSHSFYNLMPTPNLYLCGRGDPFDAVPPLLRSSDATVLYVTDGAPTEVSKRGQEYGYGRSASLAFGLMTVHLAKNASWEKLVELSREKKRDGPYPVSCSDITELGRFPRTPERGVNNGGVFKPSTQTVEERQQAESEFRQSLQRLLDRTDRKEVNVFVHGYSSEFEWPAYVIAQLWHFMGRGGVPVAYSWPSGSPGLLRGYQYDRESSEFTIYHFKQFLKLLGDDPNVSKVNIICHSRGTDVVVSALRELKLELGGPQEARQKLKLAQLVVAAADLDVEVIGQRMSAERMDRIADFTTFYVSSTDEALGISGWLFRSRRRVGLLTPGDVQRDQVQVLQRSGTFGIVDVRVKTSTIFSSHSYFFANPATSSDLILAVRDGLHCGAANGRPLKQDPSGFWILDETYPRFSQPPATSPN